MIDAFDNDDIFRALIDDAPDGASVAGSADSAGGSASPRVSLAWGAGDLDGVIDQLQGFGVGEAPLRFDELFGDGQDRHALEELLGDGLLSTGPAESDKAAALEIALGNSSGLSACGDVSVRTALDSTAPDASPNESDNAALLAHLLGM